MMSTQTRSNSQLSSKKCKRQFSPKHFDMKGHQHSADPISFASLDTSPIRSDKYLAPQIHIIHISNLKSILNEMIATFEAQSLISDSPFMCLDVENLPKLLRGIIERRCHNIRCKDLCSKNDIYYDEDGLLYESGEESEVCWSPRDRAQKALTPTNKCKTKKKGPVSISKDDVARLVTRVMMQRSGNLPRKTFPILNPEDIPDLILKEEIKPSQSKDSIYVDDIPKLIMEVMDGEISVPITDIFNVTSENLIEQRSDNIARFSPRENNEEISPQLAQKFILEDLSMLEQDVNKSLECLTTEIRRETEASHIDLISPKTERTPELMSPESQAFRGNLAPPKQIKRMPTSRCRSNKRYMEPTLSSTARTTFEDHFCAPARYTKKCHDDVIGNVRAVTVCTNNDRGVSSDRLYETVPSKGKPKILGRRYRFKECIRPWESPFHNPNRLYCLEEVKKDPKRSKGEMKLLENLRSSTPSPRPLPKKGDAWKAHVTKSETNLADGLGEPEIGASLDMSRSVERLIRVAERLKTVVEPKARRPDWDSEPKRSPKEEVISLDDEIGMKIIDNMIKPKKHSKMFKMKS